MASKNIGVILFLVIAYCSYIAYSSSEHEISNLLEYSAKSKSIEDDYDYTGEHWQLGNVTVYETRNTNSNRILILAYDIGGMHNHSRQVADKLAEAYGFRVVMPDFFRGNSPPANASYEELLDFLDQFGNWNRTVKSDILDIVEHFRTTANSTEFGLFGFCWGARVTVDATTDPATSSIIKAGGLVHPSLIVDEDAPRVNSPLYLLPAGNDPNMLQFYIVLQQKFGNIVGHRRFDDMTHGFAGSGANFGDPLNVLRVNEVIDILGAFFNRILAA